MPLYITNTTKQRHVMPIRKEGQSQLVPLIIESGGQLEISERDWAEAHLVMLIAELERRYNAIDIGETSRHPEGYSGIAYRWDKPATESQIHAGHEIVVTNQEKTSAAEATKAALGYDRAVNKGTKTKRISEMTAVEVVQDSDPRTGPSGKEIVFGLQVDPTGGDLRLAG